MFMESPLHVVGEANINVVSGFTTYGINIESHITIYYKKANPVKGWLLVPKAGTCLRAWAGRSNLTESQIYLSLFLRRLLKNFLPDPPFRNFSRLRAKGLLGNVSSNIKSKGLYGLVVRLSPALCSWNLLCTLLERPT